MPDSWFERLSRVASTLIVQWILILCGFSQPGGQSVESTDNSLMMLLEHIPTPPVSGSYPLFAVADMPLREWLAYDDNEEGTGDLHLSERAEIAMDWETVVGKIDSRTDGLSSQTIELAMTGIATQSKKTIDIDTVKDLTGLVDPPEPITKVWPPAPMYPLAPVYYPTLTLTDYALLVATPDIRMHLVQAISEQRIGSLKALIRSCEEEITGWQKQLDVLVYQKKILDDLVPSAKKHVAVLKETARTMDVLTKEIDDRKSTYPAISHILDIKTAAYKKTQGSPMVSKQVQPHRSRYTLLPLSLTNSHPKQRPANSTNDLLYGHRVTKSTSPELNQYFVDVNDPEDVDGSSMNRDMVVKMEKTKSTEQDEQTASILGSDEEDQNEEMEMGE